MSIHVPSSTRVPEVLADIAKLDYAEISAALHEPKLLTGLNRWSLWLIVCLSRHVGRQKWVGYIVESRLHGDLHRLGNEGSLGHPENIPQKGTVPGLPDWTYFFHGRGCCLTNEREGENIDVDFDKEGGSEHIDPYCYTHFLDSLRTPDFPERLLRKPAPLHNYWQQDLLDLEEMGCWRESRVTAVGTQIEEALAPLTDHLSEIQNRPDRDAKLQTLFVMLHLGDHIHAAEIASDDIVPASLLLHEIQSRAKTAKLDRARFLAKAVATKTARYGIPLQALAELGPKFSKKETLTCLFHTPVDGAANTALAILHHWNHDDLDASLQKLVEFRVSQTSLLSRLLRGDFTEPAVDRAPHESQLIRAIRIIILRKGAQVPPKFKALLIKRLKEIGEDAQKGEAAILLYVLNPSAGIEALERALFNSVPLANYIATAACVLIGTEQTKQLLIRALKSANPRQQHAAACTLSKFPSSHPIPELSPWWKAHDGISEPVGQDLDLGDRTVSTYTMDDISHANMQSRIDWTIQSLQDMAPLLATR